MANKTIPMKQGYIYLGTTSATTTLAIPYPTSGPQSLKFNFKSNTAADGTIVGQQVGRGKTTISLTWEFMDNSIWNTICNWIVNNGMAFYCRYYDINLGQWLTRQYYTLGFSATPYRPAGTNATTPGKPQWLTACSITLEDLGG